MCLYQFLIAVRSGPEFQNLTNEAGEVTSHLQGMFYRTIRMLDAGIKPVFVFDGKPPTMKKSNELAKRAERREEAEADFKAAEAAEDQEEMNRYTKRLVRVTPEHNSETRQLLRLMGVPVIEAPGEAEAQCAQLVKDDLVWATGTEDMDALTFGSKRLLRHLTFSDQRKVKISEVDLAIALRDLQLTMTEFIDLCILCGCDYTGSIKGIGPTTAYKLIKTHKTIEKALAFIDTSKHPLPDPFEYAEAAQLFINAEVTPSATLADSLTWSDPDEAGLVQFLVNEKGFNVDRVKSALSRLKAARSKSSQQRIEGFFSVVPRSDSEVKAKATAAAAKRKAEEKTKKAVAANKKAKK